VTDLPDLQELALRALRRAGIQSLEDLAQWSETDLQRLHGIGPLSLSRLRLAMSKRGLMFASAPPIKG
jgi:DNA-directed RNA polymerase alpha subunit